jgi:hypothetical protein
MWALPGSWDALSEAPGCKDRQPGDLREKQGLPTPAAGGRVPQDLRAVISNHQAGGRATGKSDNFWPDLEIILVAW